MAVRSEKFKKILKNKKIIISVGLILVLVAAGVGAKVYISNKNSKTQTNVRYVTLKKTKVESTISSSGAIKSGDSTNVYSNFTYNVQSINVSIGDVVKKGDVLATIDTTTLEQDIAQNEQSVTSSEQKAQLNLANAKQKYDNLQYLNDNNLNTDIINSEKALAAAKLDLEEKQRVYEYDKTMLSNGQISQDTLNKAKADYDNAQGVSDKSSVALEAAKVNAKQNLAQAKSDYETAEANANDHSARLQLQNKKDQLKNREVVAPVDGTVTNINAVVGQESSGALFVVQNLNNLIVNVTVDETDINKIKVGQKAEVTTAASGNSIVEGQVVSFEPVSSAASANTSSTSTSNGKSSTSSSSSSNSTSSDVTFNVKVQLTGKNDAIKVGMNSVVNIITDEKSDIYAIPYDAVLNKNGKTEVYAAVDQGGKYVVKEIPITEGLQAAANVEIQGDLSDGMIILDNPSSYTVGNTVDIKKR
ncbi:HlyD family secretion protein [Clostridium saccharoperbutylacetonicum]|uniref:HlyD family secretion protein n=1 Tax=Clostridium saccharoperbutylacetonicum TaxID=36745 RepID=UPI000983A0F8|nr:HlyD family efflux transporter periplasmic adaptor subunit [Clostridium saccharoperbutylacetonicum]AQR95828.1 multidrug resistance protein MdtN [Clostridium saccharoperbutylacetonicum]NSB31691.1 multidrug efflux pump subunit AcrA (membrane-fusion protein) [Clostridium saccharoperbutylacetonicum]